jgi:type II secretory pathway pseudopilin PulG
VRTGLVTTLVALAVAGVLAAPAASATPTERKLTRQIKTMQRQVKVLQAQVKKLRTDMRDVQGVAASALVFSACSTAATADAFQGTWETIDRNAAADTPPTPDQYPAQTPVADPLNSCQLLEVQRQPGAVPPTTNVFAALLNIFR